MKRIEFPVFFPLFPRLPSRHVLANLLHHRFGLVRKGAALALRLPRRLAHGAARPDDFAATPPALANSFPKSGTHLLDQIVAGLPGRRHYGEFVASLTSSFRFTRRPLDAICTRLRTSVPGEVIRGHLYYDSQTADVLAELNFVQYFIYRDPRDVVVSEAHYLRSINRWHRLHRYFRDAASLEDAISLSIRGMPEHADEFEYAPIGERFEDFAGWIDRDDAFAVRFEDLISERQMDVIGKMAEFYCARSTQPLDPAALAPAMQSSIDPGKSHTYRKGSSGGWQVSFTDKHRELFKQHGGEMLVKYGFESDMNW